MWRQVPLLRPDGAHSECPLVPKNDGKLAAAVSCVEDCIHPVQSSALPLRAVASPWRSSLWLLTAPTAWFYQSASLLPLFPALHVDSYHWTSGVSYVQTNQGGTKKHRKRPGNCKLEYKLPSTQCVFCCMYTRNVRLQTVVVCSSVMFDGKCRVVSLLLLFLKAHYVVLEEKSKLGILIFTILIR